MNRGSLFIVSAPSGTGKSTLIQRLLTGDLERSGHLVHAVSHTSRAPRRGEIDGKHYHFTSREAFKKMIGCGEFIEWAEVYGDYKGTSAAEVDPRLEAGIDVIVDIDVQGAELMMSARPDAISIFVLPPSRHEMERRLRTRGLDGAEQIARRLDLSRWEIERYRAYDYAIINDDLASAGEALAAIILDKRQLRERLEGRIQEILDRFPPSEGAHPQDED